MSFCRMSYTRRLKNELYFFVVAPYEGPYPINVEIFYEGKKGSIIVWAQVHCRANGVWRWLWHNIGKSLCSGKLCKLYSRNRKWNDSTSRHWSTPDKEYHKKGSHNNEVVYSFLLISLMLNRESQYQIYRSFNSYPKSTWDASFHTPICAETIHQIAYNIIAMCLTEVHSYCAPNTV